MDQIASGVWTHSVDADGFPTICSVVFSGTRAFIVDTLTGPDAMRPVVDFVEAHLGARRLVTVNTHHHWDHVYGNAAVATGDIVAHRACPRLLRQQLTSAAETLPPPPIEGVPLPTVTFGDRLTYRDAGGSVHLIHVPGHSEDSLVVFLAAAKLLLGGDTVEWPLPNFSQRGGKLAWVRSLRQLKQVPADLIVPSHGPVMSKTIIDVNERYIVGVYEAVEAQKAAGVPRHEVDVSAAPLLPEGVRLDTVYAEAHRGNVLWAWDDV